jgi:methionyl aminopeptidase
VIIKKSPAEIDQMAAAGVVLVKTMNLLGGKIRPGITTRELDQAAEKFIRGVDLRVAQLDDRPRDPGSLQA